MSTLSFKHINKIYDNNVQAVFDFNLEIADKEFIVFVGPSGCGKSTTLRMVAGLETITTGELYIDGVLVNNVEPKDRNIAMVFQNYALYPHMTVYGNMAFALKLRKVPCPVYGEVPEAKTLRDENLVTLKKIKALYKKAKKQNEPKEIFAEIDGLYDEILAKEDRIKELLEATHVVGIYQEKIDELTKLASRVMKEKAKYEAMLAKNTDEQNAKVLSEAVAQKQDHLNRVNKEIDYLKTNEVPLFKNRKLTGYEIDLEIQKAARILDLGKFLLRKPAALSGGQRQRVALGRCIVRNPKVFLMDEPLSNLDAKLRVQTRSEISKIHKRVNATTIYVTHDQTEAMTMADRIVVMKDGYIQQIGSPEEIYKDPANTFVAGFIGNPAMDFINATFDGKNLVIAPSNDSEKEVVIKLTKEQRTVLGEERVGKPVIVGIRPESLFKEGDAKLDKTAQYLPIVCDFRELLGYEAVVYTYLNGQKFLVKISSEDRIAVGDTLSIGFNSDALYFFDAETSSRIK